VTVGGLRLDETFLDLLLLNTLFAYSAYFGVLGGGFIVIFSGFIGIGAYTLTIFVNRVSESLALGLVAAAVVGACLAAVIALPMRRVAGIYLGIVSLAFVSICQTAEFNWTSLTHGASGYALPRLVGTNGLLIAAAVVIGVTLILDSSTLGLLLKLRRHDTVLAETIGLDTRRAWYWLVVASSSLAALAGGLKASWFGFIDPTAYSFSLIVTILAMVILGGSEHWAGPIVGAIVFTALPQALSRHGDWSNIIIGVVLLVIVIGAPAGIAGNARLLAIRLRSRRVRSVDDLHRNGEVPTRPVVGKHERVAKAGQSPLSAEGITWSVAGLDILNGVSLEVESGEICALVGPNGSGKSSLVNILSGVTAPSGGRVLMDGSEMTGERPHDYVRRGMSRTFQEARVLDAQTVLANVRSAAWRDTPDGTLLGLLLRAPKILRGRKSINERAHHELERAGALEFARWLAGDVSYGTRRKIELARALIARPRVLLLDEPTAGVSGEHIELMKALIQEEAARGCAILIVDHDVDVINEICDRVVVLDAGQLIYDGSVSGAFADPAVQEAYVGT
jgi:branched-chain amino acid transport system permease protein